MTMIVIERCSQTRAIAREIVGEPREALRLGKMERVELCVRETIAHLQRALTHVFRVL